MTNHRKSKTETVQSLIKVNNWFREKVAVLRSQRPVVRVLMYPAAEQNPFLVVTRDQIENLGGKVTMLHSLDSGELLRLAPKHDILHIFNIEEYTSPFASPEMLHQAEHFAKRFFNLTVAKKMGMKLFWTLYNEPKGNFSSQRLERLGRKMMFHQADKILCPSNTTRNLLLERYPTLPDWKVVHLPHHNFQGYFPKQVSKRQAWDYLGIRPKGKVFICFGGIHPYKGLTDVIPLFGKHPLKEHTLIVAGNPSNKHYAATIEGLCAQYDNVHTFLRYVSRDDLQYYLQAADIFVMPFKDVLNSGSMMLALSFGKPLVAPAVGAIPEVLSPGCSVLFQQAGSSELKKALSKALELDLEKASAEARRVSELYSAEKLARRLINYYLDFFPRRQKIPEEPESL